MDLMKPEENTQESLIQDFSLPVLGILTGAAIGDATGITAAVVSTIAKWGMHRYITPLISESESKRLYQWGQQAVKGIVQGLKEGEEFRKDGFFEETPTNRSNLEEVVESTLKKIMDTTDEPKIRFMANLTKNIHFDQDLDIDTYRQILNDLDELTYRQLCIIRLVSLHGKRKVDIDRIDNIEQVPQNELARFYSIGRDFEKMMVDDSYLDGVRGMKTEDGEPCMFYAKLGTYHISIRTIASIREPK